ncbi:pimeloyl-ACP methyl ester carboxylesterase [Pseudomonas koreensis]|uniref:alpha/beta fold hydrolase n=1 Tax=Pseudomonas koreensis TaxID=198620 RepID=UPI00285D3CC6|nr:alpha/beta hydrolase [Pseudomonas koreensis]MDR7052912.1 pimeloyl-ACP methyl ester carboxylesterase [Pseudomonas koreensis]
MATFLLIHGSWHGGWSFDPIAAELQARGHKVLAPDLPLGPDTPTLAKWARFTVESAKACGEKVILAGHSRGGLVISAAAELAPDAFESLFYISAFLVANGKTAAQFLEAAPRYQPFTDGLSVSTDGQWLMLSQDGATETMAQQCTARYRDECAPRLQREPAEPLDVVMKLTPERYGSLKRAYFECTEDLAISIKVQRLMQNDLPCDRVITVNADHTPMLSATEQLIDALDEWANDTRR